MQSTVNIWSHLIGAVIFFYLPYYMFTVAIPPRYAIATTEDIVVCSAWFLGVAICFVLSVWSVSHLPFCSIPSLL